MVYTDAFTIYCIGHIACFRKKGNKTGWKLDCYSRVPNNRKSWNNRGLDIVIIINNREGWNNRGGGIGRG